DDTNFGGFTSEYQLELDPRQLEHYGIGITDVINAVNSNNANAGGGRVSRGDQSYVIRGIGLMLKYQNPSRTLRGIHAKVTELNRKLAAQDVRIVPYSDRDTLVRATVSKVGRTVAEGIGLVFLVLIVFLGSPRSAFVVAV